MLHPDRVLGVVSIATWAPFAPDARRARGARRLRLSTRPGDTDEGWAKDNRHYWLRDWRGYAEFFFGRAAARAALRPELHEDLPSSWADPDS